MTSSSAPAVPVVETVTGPVPASDLGVTLVHEHLIVDLRCYWSPEDDPGIAFEPLTVDSLGRFRASPFAARDNLRIDDPRTLVEEINRFANAGGGTIVDVTPPGIGRDPRALEWLAVQTGINVIAGCGYYIRESHPPGMTARSREELADEMVRDLTVGIDRTSIRAGVIGEIGVATSPMDPTERLVLEAAAAAQAQTEAGIVVHSAPGPESPFEVAEVLESAGADMTRVVHSHVDERFRGDVTLYQQLAAFGSNLAFDTFGRELYYAARQKQHPTDAERIDALLDVLEAGLIDNVLLAQDICLKHELATHGGHGYDHVLRAIVPRLVDRGVSESEMDQMLRKNPARILGGASHKHGEFGSVGSAWPERNR